MAQLDMVISAGDFIFHLGFSQRQDLECNTSTVELVTLAAESGKYRGLHRVSGNIYAGGTQIAMLDSGSGAGIVNIGTGPSAVQGGFAPPYAFSIRHDPEGNAAVTVRLELTVTDYTVTRRQDLIGSGSMMLTALSRFTEITVEADSLGTAGVIRFLPRHPRFTHSLTVTVGKLSQELLAPCRREVLEWTPPLSWAREFPDRKAVTARWTVVTWQDGQEIGRRDVVTRLAIPDAVRCTPVLTVTDRLDCPGRFGGYLQLVSRLDIAVGWEGGEGASPTACRITCGDMPFDGMAAVFTPDSAGMLAITARLSDSRGRESLTRREVEILPYSRPRAVLTEVFRCDPDGSENCEAEFATIRAEMAVHPLGGEGNGMTCRVEYRKAGEDTPSVAVFQRGAPPVFAALADENYQVELVVADKLLQERSMPMTLPAAQVLMDFSRNDHAIGLGCRAAMPRTLRLGMDMDCAGHRLRDLADASQPGDGVHLGLLQRLFGIGTVILSPDSPEGILGGRWTAAQVGSTAGWKRIE